MVHSEIELIPGMAAMVSKAGRLWSMRTHQNTVTASGRFGGSLHNWVLKPSFPGLSSHLFRLRHD